MLLSRRTLISTAFAASLFPARDALALSGEPFPVREGDENLIAYKYRRREEAFATTEPAGTIVVDPRKRFLYHVLGNGRAMRYGVSVGKAGRQWMGEAVIGKKAKWPTWTPTPEHVAEFPKLTKWLPGGMPGGPENPMGARALYLYQGDADTSYRIHGTHDPKLIGQKKTAGCIGLLNSDIIHLYDQIEIGARVVVMAYS
jgi:lipoprotein-anchoring transpeptidase ErfK/SrfK